MVCSLLFLLMRLPDTHAVELSLTELDGMKIPYPTDFVKLVVEDIDDLIRQAAEKIVPDINVANDPLNRYVARKA